MITLYTQSEFNQAKYNDKLPLSCEFCKKTFLLEKRDIQRGLNPNATSQCRFCSLKCFGKSNTTKISVSCSLCNKEYTRILSQLKKVKNTFCSSSCAAKYNNSNKKYGTRTSKLESYIQSYLTEKYKFEIKFNSKEEIGSELDIYIPHLKLGFEINGIFHYRPIYGEKKFLQIQSNDIEKLKSCIGLGISLYIIDSSKQIKFSPKTSQPFLDDIINIIELHLQCNLVGLQGTGPCSQG